VRRRHRTDGHAPDSASLIRRPRRPARPGDGRAEPPCTIRTFTSCLLRLQPGSGKAPQPPRETVRALFPGGLIQAPERLLATGADAGQTVGSVAFSSEWEVGKGVLDALTVSHDDVNDLDESP
jgi:hypothetical protein